MRAQSLVVACSVLFCIALSPAVGLAGPGEVVDKGSYGEINFTASFEGFTPTNAEVNKFKGEVVEASRILWDATEGQLRIGEVTLINAVDSNQGSQNVAGVDFYVKNFQGTAGGRIVPGNFPIRSLGTTFDLHLPNIPDSSKPFDDRLGETRSAGAILAHELGHYALGLGDEYSADFDSVGASKTCEPPDSAGQCMLPDGPARTGPCMLSDDQNVDGSNHCIMQYKNYASHFSNESPATKATEFCVSSNHDNKKGCGTACGPKPDDNFRYTTQQSEFHGGDSCFHTLADEFSFISAPSGTPSPGMPSGHQDPTFTNKIGEDIWEVAVIDRSGSMNYRSDPDISEICLNGTDEDGDGEDNSENCTPPRHRRLFQGFLGYAIREAQGPSTKKMAIVSFAGSTKDPIDKTFNDLEPANRDQYSNTVNSLTNSGSTNIGGALEEAGEQLQPYSDALRTIMLFSDGRNTSGKQPVPVAETLGNDGVSISTIGVGKATDYGELDQISKKAGGVSLGSKKAVTLPAMFMQMWAKRNGASILIPELRFLVDSQAGTTDIGVPSDSWYTGENPVAMRVRLSVSA